jgi:hypothetical protein
MTDEQIIQKIMANQWWPFDRVDPKILQEAMRREKQETFNGYEEAPI